MWTSSVVSFRQKTSAEFVVEFGSAQEQDAELQCCCPAWASSILALFPPVPPFIYAPCSMTGSEEVRKEAQ